MNTESKDILDDALVLVHLRNEFYRKKFRFILGVYSLSLLMNVVLICIIVYLVRHPTPPLYFPADKSGRLIQVVSLQQNNMMSNEEVSRWVVEAIEAAYSYDFYNYRGQLQNAEKYFTTYGWRSYMNALTASNNLLALTERKQIVTARVVAPPKLINQGILSGALAWKYQMPVLVTYLMPPFNDKFRITNALIITTIVQRQNELQSYKGLGIIQMIAVNPTQSGM